ncbi:MAG: winged helix-turn-helix domain-containing protein [Pseudomonadota bacterium]
MSNAGSQTYAFDSFRLDPIRRVLTDGDGNRVELTGKAFDALIYFLEHPGVVIDRSTLLAALWPDTVVEENNLNQAVAVLRRTLGHDYITTVPRRGYQFSANVRRQHDAPAGDTKVGHSVPSRRIAFLMIAGLVVLAIGIALLGGNKTLVGEQGAPKIAVLPCDNLSPNAEDAYLALSLHQEILTQLQKLRGLLVVSRSSMMQYAETRPPVPEIAGLLNAAAVMECSVRSLGGQVVVTAQLIDPENDASFWSGSYEGDLAEASTMFRIQSEIATQVAGALGVDFLPVEQQRLERAPTASMAAYADYLKAKQSVTWGGYSLGYSEDAFHRYINQAIESDPEFALAYSDRAIGHLSRATDAFMAHDGDSSIDANAISADALLSLARNDATAALNLDPTLGRAHAVLGATNQIGGDQESAQFHFRRAIELSPNDAEILSFIVGFYLRDGRQADALPLLAQIRRLNPVDRDVAFYFYLAGDRNTALQLLRRMLKLDPDDPYIHALIGYCLAIDEVAEEAESALRLAEELYRRDRRVSQQGLSAGMLSTLAYAYSRIGQADDVRRLTQQFMQVAENASVNTMRWVEIHIALGDVDRAYEVATELVKRPLPAFVSLELDFVLNTYNDPIFDEPRFAELRRELGGQAFPD